MSVDHANLDVDVFAEGRFRIDFSVLVEGVWAVGAVVEGPALVVEVVVLGDGPLGAIEADGAVDLRVRPGP